MKRFYSRKTKMFNPEPNYRDFRLAAIGTLEIVIIIAILLGVALIFRTQITDFSTKLFENAFNTSYVEDLNPGNIG